MEKMQNCELPYPDGAPGKERSGLLLRQDLSAVRVRPARTNSRILLEPKRETKKRLGRSPDRGDCYVIGVWGSQFVPEEGPGADSAEDDDSTDLADSYATKSAF
jgi:hypothetical protein